MSRAVLEFKETGMVIRHGEALTLQADCSPWTPAPTAPVVTVINRTTGADVSATVLSGSPSVAGSDITLPTIGNVTGFPDGTVLRVTVQFSGGAGAPYRPYLDLIVVEA